MKITKIEVKNYRLLKEFSIDLEDELSLVVGKNNTGKTSLLSVLDKFLNSRKFQFDDFNLDFQKELKTLVESAPPQKFYNKGITLKLFIEYDEEDNLANISKLMMDLAPNSNTILLSFEFVLTLDKLQLLHDDYKQFQKVESEKVSSKDFYFFIKEGYEEYFSLIKKTIDPKDHINFIDLKREGISLSNIINFQFIRANREVSNKEANNSLSSLSSFIYEKVETGEEHKEKISEFKETLRNTDFSLSKIYNNEKGIFSQVIEKVKKFGGLKPNDTSIKINSSLQHRELLKGNTTVVYNHDSHELPENYNGLGYMNLINMIFEIEILLNEFKKHGKEKPADINLLFIEEPEAHTHPQMQYIFINNIKGLLKDCISPDHTLQYVVSTHSSHIVSESNFDDIKYLKRDKNSVFAKNLKDLAKEYEDDQKQSYRFLKQYLTLHRAELFFADKAIFIEGDTERILLPAMMKKLDLEDTKNPLLSQNISIVETGAYSHKFEKFIDFVGIKSLIITDIDSAISNEKFKEKGPDAKQKVKVDNPDASITTNSSLKYFYGTGSLEFFKGRETKEMLLSKKVFKVGDREERKWDKDKKGILLCVYQTEEKGYHARSFEDAFFHINRQFIINNKTSFSSLKNIEDFDDETNDAFDLAENCVSKKPALAIEILLNSCSDSEEKEFDAWQIPEYIKKGLLWLKEPI